MPINYIGNSMVTKANNVSRLTAAFVFQAMEKKRGKPTH